MGSSDHEGNLLESICQADDQGKSTELNIKIDSKCLSL